MPSPPGPHAAEPELEVWAELEQVHAGLARGLDRVLAREHDLSLHEFELLDAVGSAPAQRLRMSELAARVPLTASGLTRMVARLARDGLVARVECSVDGRVTYVQLTDAGRARLHAAAETHAVAVGDLLHRLFPPEAVLGLRRLLRGAR